MTEKGCSEHRKNRRRKRIRQCCAGLLIFNFILLVLILIIWAILQPRKPRFVLQDATIFAFNVSSPNYLTSNIQITIYSRNPNDKIGIYYDKLDVYGSYRNQQITYYTSIPPTYQGHKDVNVWSPLITGNERAGGAVQRRLPQPGPGLRYHHVVNQDRWTGEMENWKLHNWQVPDREQEAERAAAAGDEGDRWGNGCRNWEGAVPEPFDALEKQDLLLLVREPDLELGLCE
ncbi:hypothetical protein F0562_015974 [Nyssa sinensis]|uniref:Late embryogenesis abundant protein LEA-2 subgroup domain-containing protein n=1 Tax=Nyssa sinensis TaxID=561372 RepID=A0A5J4ZIL4_9ASTE|nr:hypothetical protein F0562_015974 [Nyssa sinensis]